MLVNFSWGPGKVLDFLSVKEWEPCKHCSEEVFLEGLSSHSTFEMPLLMTEGGGGGVNNCK